VKHYPAVWSWEAFGEIDHDKSDCAIAAKACEQVFSLPIFPDTTFEDLEYVGWAIKESIAALRSQ
jgi:dTDP-4-amino-4,6-dideoxygalactose transaminase